MSPLAGQVSDVVTRAAAGRRTEFVERLERYRARLRRMVALRIDPRLRGRLAASDVSQEGCFDAMRRLDEFIRDPSLPCSIWLRFVVGLRTQKQDRRHVTPPGEAGEVGP